MWMEHSREDGGVPLGLECDQVCVVIQYLGQQHVQVVGRAGAKCVILASSRTGLHMQLEARIEGMQLCMVSICSLRLEHGQIISSVPRERV